MSVKETRESSSPPMSDILTSTPMTASMNSEVRVVWSCEGSEYPAVIVKATRSIAMQTMASAIARNPRSLRRIPSPRKPWPSSDRRRILSTRST